jgi:prepilin-type N-terminal cleavage/methylation domain-containing protein
MAQAFEGWLMVVVRHRPSIGILLRSAFTLVELLVVLGIVGLLVSLLLPAVQAAREAARKSHCQNNLRQVGLAIQNYESSLRTMPTGCLQWRPWNGDPKLKNMAWSAMLLPFMEQTQLHRLVSFDYPFDHPINAQAAMTRLSVYLCPSAPDLPTQSGRARTDFAGLYGQRITTRQHTDNGVFIYDRSIRFREISDGITNTLAVAEDTGGPDAEWINGSNVFEQSGRINDPKAWAWDNEIRSKHPGGAMLLFCCGRVQFVSDSMDVNVLAATITRNYAEVISDN